MKMKVFSMVNRDGAWGFCSFFSFCFTIFPPNMIPITQCLMVVCVWESVRVCGGGCVRSCRHLNAASARIRFDWAVIISHLGQSECYCKGNAGGGSPTSGVPCSRAWRSNTARRKWSRGVISGHLRGSAGRSGWGAAVQGCCWRGLEDSGAEKGKLLLSTHIVHVPYLSWDIPGSGWISAEIRLRDDSCAATETA